MSLKESINEMKIHHEERKEERHERHEEKKFAHELNSIINPAAFLLCKIFKEALKL